MKLSEAKSIVRKMTMWSMLASGVPFDENPDPITEDLETLIKANRIVVKANDRSSHRAEQKRQSGYTGIIRLKTQMTIADRGIAALYVAANFAADDPANCTPLAINGDAALYLLDRRRLGDDTDELP